MATFLTFCVLITAFGFTVIRAEVHKGELRTLRRQKREWIVPPKKLYENVDYTREVSIAKIRSDEETRENIVYSLLGPAADDGLFRVGPKNGFVTIHGILDREKTAFYELKGRATLRNGGLAERDLDLQIIVLDQNDNPPVFKVDVIGSVDELSDEGSHVISITAIDLDEPGTPHTQIVYEVRQQEPAGNMMFRVDRVTGEIKVRLNTLDRETQDTYRLLITGTDMNGMSSGTYKPLTGTGTVTINVLDVNDNIPVLEKSYYVVSVEENVKNVEVIRIKALDKDKVHTENWEAVYTIVSGNEAGYFHIITDNKTNEGILIVTKELDYEELKELDLKVVVRNKASYHKSVLIDKPTTYPIKINVVNMPEAPHFRPAVRHVNISEDKTTIDLKKVITTYRATDSDTLLTATNVRYVKGEDIDNWLSIDEHTAEIRLNKYPDRESVYLKNGTYHAKILAITDGFPQKTATGTVELQVLDFNDHCPILTSSVATMCYGHSVLNVTAIDGDKFPNAEPFTFTLVTTDTKEKWSLDTPKDTTVILRSKEILWPGHYPVTLEVKDQQGKSCDVQQLQVSVCTCTDAQVCRPERQTSTSTGLGAGGVLAFLLGILLLLLIPLLVLLCECGGAAATNGFQAFPFEQKQQLITYQTEGQGEDKELSLLTSVPAKADIGSGVGVEAAFEAHEDWRKYGWQSQEDYTNYLWCKHLEPAHANANGIGEYSNFHSANSANSLGFTALSGAFFSDYYAMKTLQMMSQEACANHMLVSNYEDCVSVASSFDDLSIYAHEENNLDFLNDLGPRFKRLAEICRGSDLELDGSATYTAAKTITSSSQVGVNVEGGVHNEAASVSVSSSSSTAKVTTTNYSENISTGATTSAATVGQTLLVQQQPTIYLSTTPMYVMEQQPQHTLFLASGPIMGVQERNVVLMEEGATNRVIAAQNTLPRLGMQQANTALMVDAGIGGTVMHGFSGHSEPRRTGSFRVVESRRIESTVPVHSVQSSTHSSISKSHSMQAKGQSGLSSALETASGFPRAQKDAGVLHGLNGGTRKEVQEERVSVVKKSFQTSATS